MSFKLVCVSILLTLASGCKMPPDNSRGDDWGATRGPLSAPSDQESIDPSNPSRW